MFTTLAHLGGPLAAGPGLGWLLLFVPLFWIALLAVLFAVFGRRWRRARLAGGYGVHGHWGSPARSAEQTLAERFAQGDIEEKEYRARLEVLRANNGAAPFPKD